MGATAVMGFGMGFSAMGSRNAGKAQQKLANYNAQVAEVQAQDAIEIGRQEEETQRLQTRGLIGSQRAAFAASGVDVNTGSAVDVQADTAKFGELDALTIRMNAAREAWGYRAQATNMRAQGTIAKQRGNMEALGSIVSTAGKAYGKKYGF